MIEEDRPQAYDQMSSESIECLCECLAGKLRELRSGSNHYGYTERSLVSAFLTALFGSGFVYRVREEKGYCAAAIQKLAEGDLAKLNGNLLYNAIYNARREAAIDWEKSRAGYKGEV